MVLLENVNVNELKLENFKDFKCPCELCDDGCFDRRKQTHNADCKRHNEKTNMMRNTMAMGELKKKGQSVSSLSHYKDVFKSDYNARPATMCRPSIETNIQVPQVAMDLNTVQKIDFKPYETRERTRPIKKLDNYQKPEEPFVALSSYKVDFIKKDNNAFASIVKKNPNEAITKMSVEPLSSSTTNKENYKRWDMPKLERGYTEYPTLAGYSLFPTSERQFKTSTGEFHKAFENPPKRALVTKADVKSSIALEGDMNMGTNYRDSFVRFNSIERVKKIVPSNQMESVSLSVDGVAKPRPNFSLSKSQTKADYVHHFDHRPAKPADCNSFVSHLDEQIYPGNNRDHTTMYSSEYVKFDSDKVERTKSFKKENPVYKKPEQKLESETVTQRDFRPIDISKVPLLRAHKIDNHLKLAVGPMETKSTTMLQFVPHEIKPIVLAKDPHPDVYVPKMSKFSSSTTTKDTFRGEQAFDAKPKSFKPDFDNIQIDKNEKLNLKTNYRDEYVKHGLTLCESKAYQIAKTLAAANSSTIASI